MLLKNVCILGGGGFVCIFRVGTDEVSMTRCTFKKT